jgi:F0F1-type ATP synthase membrane subunit b/b'
LFDFFDRANYPGRRGYYLDDQGDSGSGGGGGTGSDNPDDTPGGTGGGTSGGDQAAGQGSDKTFTQDEVNALIARETAKAQRGKLDPSELGFQSGKELKDFLDAAKKSADEAKTDAERQLEEAKTNAAREAEQKVLSKANSRLVAAEFKVAAKDAGVVALDDALVLAQKMDIWQQVELEGDDDVTVKGFDASFFEELKKAKPYLFAPDGGRGSDIGAGAGGGNAKVDKNSPEELRKRYSALPG